MLCWAGIVWHILSANQIVRCFKLKKLKNYMRYQVEFLLSLKLQKISYYLGLCRKILLANQFAEFFTFDLFDLLIRIPGVHCYIVLVWFCNLSFFFLSTQTSSALFFQYNTQLGPPYHVLVDTNFINFSIQNKLDIFQSMVDCLYANCKFILKKVTPNTFINACSAVWRSHFS